MPLRPARRRDRLRPQGAWPAILALSALAACAPKPTPAPPIPTVGVATVALSDLHDWDDFTGRLEAVQSVSVQPRVTGYIDEIRFIEGGRVRRGQVLYQIDPRPFRAEVDRLQAEVAKAAANAQLAKADADRAKRLIDQNAIAQGDFERFSATEKVAAAEAAAAQAQLATARLNLSYTTVLSPIDGRVSRALITRGNLVTPASLLTTIVSQSPIYATFSADEQAYLKYAGGQRETDAPVYVGLATESGYPHRGRLSFVDNAVDAGSGTITGRAILDNADGKLTPGLFGRVRLVSPQTEAVALLPEEALGADLGRRFVLVVDATDHARYRPVTLGPSLDGFRVITAGLAGGERVIVVGLQKVKPGDRVIAKPAPPATRPPARAELDVAG
jgi:multidrug efflux system membrane fusion protein